MQAAMRLSELGVSDLLDVNEGIRPDDARHAVSKAFSDATTLRVWQAVTNEFEQRGDRCPDDLVTLLKRALRHAHSHLPASRLAALVQMHERTLRKYCEARSLPSPQILVGWARLLTAALYLDDPGRNIAEVADLLGYPTPSALRKQIARYTRRSPRELRDDGAVRVVTSLFHQAVRPELNTEPSRPRLTLVRDEGVA
jgi:AraC-like DNA-binding protein